MATTTCSEFSLHVHKKFADAQRGDVYTIGVWEGSSVLRAICHAQRIDDAVTAFRNFLQEAGRPVEICKPPSSSE